MTEGYIIVSFAIRVFIDQVDLPSTSSLHQQVDMQSFALLLAFASSAFAYLVNVPNADEGWGPYGPQRYVLKSILQKFVLKGPPYISQA